MGRILGLDLGTNSIGWAIVEADINAEGQVVKYHSICDSGVRIFPEGVTDLGKKEEKSNNAKRREFRQKRRQFYRKRLRKIKLLEILIEKNMCPLSLEELKKWKYYHKNTTDDKREFPNSPEFNEWLKLNPYELRSRALKEDLTLEELGRILYHFIQRRGFVSSRKVQGADTGALYKGKDDKVGISETQERMENKLLGEYLYSIIPEKGEPYKQYRDEDGKILRARSRYTLRDMYIEELYHIWQRQAKHLKLNDKKVIHKKTRILNGALTSKRNAQKIKSLEVKYGKENIKIDNNVISSFNEVPLFRYLAGEIWMEDGSILHKNTHESVLFWQRPLRSQKNLLGKCRYEHNITYVKGKKIETGKSPCYISHPEFELFRAYQLINNIEYGTKQKLDSEQRNLVLELLNSKKSNFKFKDIPKKLKLTSERFNYDDDFSVPCNKTIANIKPLFDLDTWNENYCDIWHCFHFYDDNEKLFKKLIKDYACKCKSVEDIKKIHLSADYGSLSLKAIRNINPFLAKGYSLSLAVILGGVKNVFGQEKWDLSSKEHDLIENTIKHFMKEKNAEGELIEKIKIFLSSGYKELDFGFAQNDKRFKKLYHPSVDLKSRVGELIEKLPEIPNLRNPLVQRALSETRHVVNALIKSYGKMDIIKVEMGRDLKNNSKIRQEMSYKINDNRKRNDAAREKLSEFGLAHTRQNVRKYLLFKEIEEHQSPVVCPYTGKTIRINDVLGTGNLFQIEHIVPYSISLDDSFGNITLCESNFNREKGEKTPYEFYKINSDTSLWGGASSWDNIERRALSLLPYNKAKRFTSKKQLDQENFISRQLNDMRYISREAKNLLMEICDNVQILPGKLTADLRRLWGLNNVLQPAENITDAKLNIDVSKDYKIPHWAIVREDGSFVSVHKKQNDKPIVSRGYCIFPGQISKGIFKSSSSHDLAAEDKVNGKYWCKIAVNTTPTFYRYYNERPKGSSRTIVVKGRVYNEKFSYENIAANITAKDKPNGKYWANFDVLKVNFIDKERPKPKKGQLAVWGKIENGFFNSYYYSCPTDHADADIWAVLDLDIGDITLTRVLADKPNVNSNQILLSGSTDEDGAWISEENPDQSYATDLSRGKYWAVFDAYMEEMEFFTIENEEPKANKNEKLIEGSIWIDKQGEVRFDPKKNREDQRHHAIDALAIACTERSFLQKLSTYNALLEERKRGKKIERPEFDAPWEKFRVDVQKSADKILVSYFKNNRAFDSGKKFVTKNGKKHLVQISSVRGQLHKETVFGKRTAPDGQTAYHVRKSITSLASKTHVDKVVDKSIRKLIETHLEEEYGIDISQKYTVPNNAFYKDGQYAIKLPNKNGEEVPVTKVRMREKLGNVKKIKSNINQYADLQNNHHVMIYKDQNGDLKESIVSFWDVTQRAKRREPIFQLPNDGTEIVTTMEINDMFLIGLPEYIDMKDESLLSKYLYRVQKLSSNFYTFRHHLASTLNNSDEELCIWSMRAWIANNPKKVNIGLKGKILND